MNKTNNTYYGLGLILFIIFWSMTAYLVLFASGIDFEEKFLDLLRKKPEARTTRFFIIVWLATCILSPILLRISNLRKTSLNGFRAFVLDTSRYMVIMFFLAPILLILVLIIVLGSIGGGLGVG